jgi:hypothetical protein
MRSLMAIVCALCTFGLSQQAACQGAARDFKASDQRILECLASVTREMKGDTRRQCIGQETRRCLETTENAASHVVKMLSCVSAEEMAWSGILDKTYASIRERIAGTPYASALPLLASAHEAWLATTVDCEAAAALVGPGSDPDLVPARCRLHRIAERVLFYRDGY